LFATSKHRIGQFSPQDAVSAKRSITVISCPHVRLPALRPSVTLMFNRTINSTDLVPEKQPEISSAIHCPQRKSVRPIYLSRA